MKGQGLDLVRAAPAPRILSIPLMTGSPPDEDEHGFFVVCDTGAGKSMWPSTHPLLDTSTVTPSPHTIFSVPGGGTISTTAQGFLTGLAETVDGHWVELALLGCVLPVSNTTSLGTLPPLISLSAPGMKNMHVSNSTDAEDVSYLILESPNGDVRCRIHKRRSIYGIKMKPKVYAMTTAPRQSPMCTELLHRILGHASPKRLRLFAMRNNLTLTDPSGKVGNCVTCRAAHAIVRKPGRLPPLPPLPEGVSGFNSHVSIDLIILAHKREILDFPYGLFILDSYTGLVLVCPLASKHTSVVIAAFESAWILRFGIPMAVRSDRGTEFSAFRQQCFHELTAAYSPQSNGRNERSHRDWMAILRSFNQLCLPWHILCPYVTAVANALSGAARRAGTQAGEARVSLSFYPGRQAVVHHMGLNLHHTKLEDLTVPVTILYAMHSGAVRVWYKNSPRIVHPMYINLLDHHTGVTIGTQTGDATVGDSAVSLPSDDDDDPVLPGAIPSPSTQGSSPITTGTPSLPNAAISGPSMHCQHSDHAMRVSSHPSIWKGPMKPGRCAFQCCRFCCIADAIQSPARAKCTLHTYDAHTADRYKDCVLAAPVATESPLFYVCSTTGAYIDTADGDAAKLAELQGWRERRVYSLVKRGEAASLLRSGRAQLLPTHWVLVQKADGRTKARLVLRGDRDRREGVDSNVPVANSDGVRLFLTLVPCTYVLLNVDVKQAYLHASFDSDTIIYIRAPDGNDEYYWKLDRAVYGARDAGALWHKHLCTLLSNAGYHPLRGDPCLFVKGAIRLLVYVDDLLCAGPSADALQSFIHSLPLTFGKVNTIPLGGQDRFGGINITRGSDGTTTLSTNDKLISMHSTWTRFTRTPLPSNLTIQDTPVLPAPMVRTYQSILGSLSWIQGVTRPDIGYAVNLLSRFQARPTEQTLQLLNRLLTYAKCNSAFLPLNTMSVSEVTSVVIHADASHGATLDEHRATNGYVVFLQDRGLRMSPIAWKSRLARSARSSMAAELSAAVDGCAVGIYIRDLFAEAFGTVAALQLCVDSRCVVDAICIQSRTLPKDRSLTMRLQLLREWVSTHAIDVTHIASSDNRADELTKPLPETALNVLSPTDG